MMLTYKKRLHLIMNEVAKTNKKFPKILLLIKEAALKNDNLTIRNFQLNKAASCLTK